MTEPRHTLAMRIEGEGGPSVEADALGIIRRIDPGATLVIDGETGIAHIGTVRQAIEIEDVLVKAGFSVLAPTG